MLPIQKKDPQSTRMGDEEESSTVINLSRVALNNDKIRLLPGGLSFCPNP